MQYSTATNQPLPPKTTLVLYNSYIARFGQWIEPVFKPLGQDWKNSLAIVSSFAGRTIIVSTLVTLYGIEHGPYSSQTLTRAISADPSVSKRSALTLMLFVLLCGSCLASITLFYHQTRSIALVALFFFYPLVIAWTASAVFYYFSGYFL